MMDKTQIHQSFREIVKGRFSKRDIAGFNCLVIYDADFARALHSSDSGSDFEGKYDPWVSLTEWDGGLRLAAMEGLSLSRRSFFLDLVNGYAGNFDKFIAKNGGFPGGVVESSEVAEDFSAIFLYAMATVDSGKTQRIYEEMFLAYQSGGWPCGWLGKYPEGKIVVFYPS